MFVHALIRVSVLGVALPTSSAFISVEVTNLHGEAWCCLSLHVRLAWGGTESVGVAVFIVLFLALFAVAICCFAHGLLSVPVFYLRRFFHCCAVAALLIVALRALVVRSGIVR